MTTLRDTTSYDEGTLVKVHNALSQAGLSSEQISDAVNAMLNEGILFRERPSN